MPEGFRFQQLPFNHVVHINQLVLIAEFALEEVVHFLDDLGQIRFVLLVELTAAGFGDGVQLRRLTGAQGHGLAAGVLEVVMRENYFGEADALALATEFQQRQQALVEDGALLDGRVAVIEDLRKEGVEPNERTQVGLEQDERIQLVLRRLGRCFVVLFPGHAQHFARGLVAAQQAVRHGFQRGHQFLLRHPFQFRFGHAVHLEVIVIPLRVQLGAQVED